MDLAEALDTVRRVAAVRTTDVQTLSLARAHGRVLAEPMRTAVGVPIPAAAPGRVLTPLRVAHAAAAAVEVVRVRRRPTVAVFVVEGADRPAVDAAQALLTGLLRADGLEPTAWPALPADARSVEIALRDAGCAFDAVVVCGDGPARRMAADTLVAFGDVRIDALDADGDAGGLRFATLDAACVLVYPLDPLALAGLHLTLGRALLDALEARTEARPLLHGRLRGTRSAAGTFEWANVAADESGAALFLPIVDAGDAPEPDAVLLPVVPASSDPGDVRVEAVPLRAP